MLVISRRPKEKLMIGDNIEITVRRVQGNRVTIAVSAPPDVRVRRGELMEREAEASGGNDGEA